MPGFAVGGSIWDLSWRGKRLNVCVGGGRWCQVLEGVLGGFRVIQELKSPSGVGAFGVRMNHSTTQDSKIRIQDSNIAQIHQY